MGDRMVYSLAARGVELRGGDRYSRAANREVAAAGAVADLNSVWKSCNSDVDQLPSIGWL